MVTSKVVTNSLLVEGSRLLQHRRTSSLLQKGIMLVVNLLKTSEYCVFLVLRSSALSNSAVNFVVFVC